MSLGRLRLGELGNGEPLRDIAFRNWFGASKVVDARGKPKVVYHGSPQADFTSFDAQRAGSRTGRNFPGIYFSDTGGGAQTYAGWRAPILERRDFAEMRAERQAESRARWGFDRKARPGVYAVYLRIEHPFVVDFQGRSWEDRAIDVDSGETYWGMDEVTDVAAGFDAYDGVIANNLCDEGPFGHGYCPGNHTYVVWNANQIKSANANSGAFSRKTDNILMGLGGFRLRR